MALVQRTAGNRVLRNKKKKKNTVSSDVTRDIYWETLSRLVCSAFEIHDSKECTWFN